MISPKLKHFVSDNKLAFSALFIASVALLWFSGSFVMKFIYFNDPEHQDEFLKGWMTPQYVSMSYSVPRRAVFDILDISEDGHGPKHLKDIALKKGVSLSELNNRMVEGAAIYRANHQ